MVCQECRREADPDADGWRAFIADDPRTDEAAAVAVYCPGCAAREFGPAGERRGPPAAEQ